MPNVSGFEESIVCSTLPMQTASTFYVVDPEFNGETGKP